MMIKEEGFFLIILLYSKALQRWRRQHVGFMSTSFLFVDSFNSSLDLGLVPQATIRSTKLLSLNASTHNHAAVRAISRSICR